MVQSLRKEALVVILGSYAVTLKIVLYAYGIFHFNPPRDYGIVSWVTVNAYPINSHIYYYGLFFIITLLLGLFFHLLWIVTSHVMAKAWKISYEQASRIDAYTYIFGILGVLALFIDTNFFLKILPFFIGLIFVPKFFAYNIYTRVVNSGVITKIADTAYIFLKKIFNRKENLGEKKTDPFLKKLFIYAIIPALIYLVLYDPGLNRPIEFYHEGELLTPYQEMLYGKTPYKDFFVMHGILHNVWLPYIGLKLFGVTLEGFRRFYSNVNQGLIAPLGYISLYALCLVTFRRRITSLIGVILLLCAIGHVITARQMFAILALASVVSFINGKKGYELFTAGIFTAIAIMFSSEFGILTFIAVALLLIFYSAIEYGIRDLFRYIVPYMIGFIAGILPFILYLSTRGALFPYLNAVFFDFLKYHSLIFGLPFRLDHEEKYFPIFIYGIGVIWFLWKIIYGNFTKTSLKCAVLLIAGILFFYPALIRPDSPHVRSASFLAYITMLIPAESFFLYIRKNLVLKRSKAWQRFFLYNMIAALSIGIISIWTLNKFSPKDITLSLINNVRNAYRIPEGNIKLNIDRAGSIYIPKEQAGDIAAIVKFINNNTKKDDYIYDFSNRGLYYFLVNRKNPTKYPFIIYASSSQQQREVVHDLARARPKYVIAGDVKFDGIKNAERFPIVWSYIRKHYEPVLNVGDLYILEGKTPQL